MVTGPKQPSPLLFVPIPVGLLRDADADRPGFYYAVGTFPTYDWRNGGVLYISRDGGSTYQSLSKLGSPAKIGFVETALGTLSNISGWDRKNTLIIDHVGELESRSELEILNGWNWAMVGDEVIAFKNAVLQTTDNQYKLDTLLRGLMSTEGEVSNHAAGEMFVLLDSRVTFVPLDMKDLGAPLYFKAVPAGHTVSDALAYPQTIVAPTFKNYSPVHISSSRDGSNNITVDWFPRSRGLLGLSIITDQRLPGDDEDNYEIDLMTFPLDGTVSKTYSVTTTQLSTILAADQTAAGWTPPEDVQIRIYPMSRVGGRGKYWEGMV